MKQNQSTFIRWQGVILSFAVVLYGLLEPAYCQDTASQSSERQPWADGTVLLLQQMPPQSGEVNPATGVHYFNLNAEVTLTAIPKPGYYFVYWIGDVSDPTANSTIAYLDIPKIIIAVFERSEYDLLLEEQLQNTLGGYSSLRGRAGDYSNTAGGGVVIPDKYKQPEWPDWNPPAPPEKPELPDDFPIPLPEPATILLLGLGGLLFIRRKVKR